MTRISIATLLGLAWIGAAAPSVAASPDSPLLYGYDTNAGHLVSFYAATPGLIEDDVLLTGLAPADEVLGMDFFPLDRLLYGVVRNGTTYRVVRIDVNSGAVTSIGPDQLDAPTDTAFGVDFNPTVDRIRVGGTGGSNFRMNPFTGALTGTDTEYAYALGDPSEGHVPQIAHVAYDRNDPDATSTSLFGIDVARDALVQIGGVNGVPSPNQGMLFTVGLLGVDAGPAGGFDIESGTGDAYAVLSVAGASVLHSIHLGTGIATPIGMVGGGSSSIAAFAVPEPEAGAAALALGVIAALARLRLARR